MSIDWKTMSQQDRKVFIDEQFAKVQQNDYWYDSAKGG